MDVARPRLIAHRGAPREAPEHTIPAYEAALGAGADALALDVRLSADDQLVVIHDARLERTTDGRGTVRDRTAQELKRLDAGGWFGRRFRGQRIQTLLEVLERFRDRADFLVRLPGDPGEPPVIEDRLVTLLQIYGMTDRTLIASIDPDALARCRGLDPDVRTAAIALADAPQPAGEWSAIYLPAGATAAEIATVVGAGREAYVGVVDDPDAARRFAAWRVAGIVTARPDVLRPVL